MSKQLQQRIEQLKNHCIKHQLQLGLAETCTGGLFSSLCTQGAGASNWFTGAAVVYSNECKNRLLKVNQQTLQRHGAVSKNVAQEMASGVIQQMQCDVAISVTGIAGPDGGSTDKPVGTVFVGYASIHSQDCIQLQLDGSHRDSTTNHRASH